MAQDVHIDSKDNQTEKNPADVNFLKHQLKMRDQLVDQLSGQLFQMIQDHPPALPAARSSLIVGASSSSNQNLQELEEQITFYQNQIDQRDSEIAQLKKSCQELSDRNQMLETVIQDLPEVYRQQFASRLEQFKEKLQSLKVENRRLMGELNQRKSSTSSDSSKRKLFLPYNRSNSK